MGRRYKLEGKPRHYVERDRRGRFKHWTNVRRSMLADARKKVDQKRKETGYGHIQDYYPT